jgi:DNA-directed RNA polymerase specialized sigma24 family protein
MPNCRSIPPEEWAYVREALVRYFATRHGRQNAEDLAQQTLTKVWEREDYEFETISDFPKVCLGFARKISLSDFRGEGTGIETLEFEPAAPGDAPEGQRAIESQILQNQILEIGAKRLKIRELQALREAITSGDSPSPVGRPVIGNRERVYLHRIREKLRGMTGLGKNRV